MKNQYWVSAIWLAIAWIACSFVGVPPPWAQKAPPPANPQAPTINALPTAIQRGVPAEFTISGTQLASPTGVSLGVPAKVTITTDEKKPDAAKFKVRVEVPGDAPIGWYPLRVATLKGASNLRVVCIDDLPQVVS